MRVIIHEDTLDNSRGMKLSKRYERLMAHKKSRPKWVAKNLLRDIRWMLRDRVSHSWMVNFYASWDERIKELES